MVEGRSCCRGLVGGEGSLRLPTRSLAGRHCGRSTSQGRGEPRDHRPRSNTRTVRHPTATRGIAEPNGASPPAASAFSSCGSIHSDDPGTPDRFRLPIDRGTRRPQVDLRREYRWRCVRQMLFGRFVVLRLRPAGGQGRFVRGWSPSGNGSQTRSKISPLVRILGAVCQLVLTLHRVGEVSQRDTSRCVGPGSVAASTLVPSGASFRRDEVLLAVGDRSGIVCGSAAPRRRTGSAPALVVSWPSSMAGLAYVSRPMYEGSR